MKRFIYFLAIQLLFVSFGFSKSTIAAVKSEEYYSKGVPIPEEWVTPGATLDWLIENTENPPENPGDWRKGGDVFNILDELRKTNDYSQLEKLRKFAEISQKKSRRYRDPETYMYHKSPDWSNTYYEAAKVVIADLEKAKAEDEASGRTPKIRDAGAMSEDGQDVKPRAKGKAADSTTNQKSNQIEALWWLLAPLLLLILFALRIVMPKR